MSNFVTTEIARTAPVETLERIRLTAKMSRHDWLDLLGMQYSEYQKFKSGQLTLSESSLRNVAGEFAIPVQLLESGAVDFSDLSIRLEDDDVVMPEKYRKAAYSRKRSLLSAFDYLEKTYGWRLRLDIQQKFGVPERQLQNAFETISIRFITDMCQYLKRRSFAPSDFHAMGSYAFEGNRNTVVAKLFGQMRSPAEAFEFLFGDALKLYEQNCEYKIVRLDRHHAVIDMISNPHVAAETGVRHLGNEHTCHFKGGIIASTPRYLGLPEATVTHTTCVHRGDSRCRYEIEYGEAVTALAAMARQA